MTLAIAARAAELRASGADVISLAAGQPDFSPPAALRHAAKDWIEGGDGRYTNTSGMPELRSILAQQASERGLELGPENVLVGSGTKPLLFQALAALLEPGDEVLVLAPYWVSYPAIVRLAGGVPRLLSADESDSFRPDPEALEREFARPRLRAAFFNSPNNPTGRVADRDEVESLMGLARTHGVTILSDEIYRTITYDGAAASPADCDRELDATLVFDGLSKSHAVPGWRMGWTFGPADMIAAMGKIQSQIHGNPSSIPQAAAKRAFDADTLGETRAMVEEFHARRDYVVQRLSEIDDLTLIAPRGAFYALPGVHRILERRGIDDVQLCKALLDECGVALVPGSAFGASGHVRMSFAASQSQLEVAFDRIRDHLVAT